MFDLPDSRTEPKRNHPNRRSCIKAVKNIKTSISKQIISSYNFNRKSTRWKEQMFPVRDLEEDQTAEPSSQKTNSPSYSKHQTFGEKNP